MKKSILITAFAAILTPLTAVSIYIWNSDICITDKCEQQRKEELEKLIENEWSKIGKIIEKKLIISDMAKSEFDELIVKHYEKKGQAFWENYSRVYPKLSEKCRLYVYQDMQNKCHAEIQQREGDKYKSIQREAENIQSSLDELIRSSKQLIMKFKISNTPKNSNELNELVILNKKFDDQFHEKMSNIAKINNDFDSKVQDKQRDLASVSADLSQMVGELNNLIKKHN